MIYYNDQMYDELRDIIDDLEMEDSEIHDLPDSCTLEAYEMDLEKIQKLDADFIANAIQEDRYPEDDERIYKSIIKILNDNIDFEKINSLLPQLYYESNRKIIFTKVDLIAEID